MQLSPEQINEFLSKAILESQIGEAVQQSITRVMEELKRTYNNPFDDVIKKHINQIIDSELLTTHRAALQDGIRTRLEQYLTDEIIQKIMDAAMERLRRNY